MACRLFSDKSFYEPILADFNWMQQIAVKLEAKFNHFLQENRLENVNYNGGDIVRIYYFLCKCLRFPSRRLHCVVDYFLFFFNALLSLFTSFKRIVLSMAFGIIYLSRLDQCGMMRGLERFDNGNAGYFQYISFGENIHFHFALVLVFSPFSN